jgi:hypothetical protein
VIFLGTPHNGSGAADLGSLCAKVLRRINRKVNISLINDLKRSSALLGDISATFKNCQADLVITSFYETQTTFGRLIVSKDSASLGDSYPQDADHVELVKFDCQSNPRFQSVVKEIIKMVNSTSENISPDHRSYSPIYGGSSSSSRSHSPVCPPNRRFGFSDWSFNSADLQQQRQERDIDTAATTPATRSTATSLNQSPLNEDDMMIMDVDDTDLEEGTYAATDPSTFDKWIDWFLYASHLPLKLAPRRFVEFVTQFGTKIFVRAIVDGQESRIKKLCLASAKILIQCSKDRPKLMKEILSWTIPILKKAVTDGKRRKAAALLKIGLRVQLMVIELGGKDVYDTMAEVWMSTFDDLLEGKNADIVTDFLEDTAQMAKNMILDDKRKETKAYVMCSLHNLRKALEMRKVSVYAALIKTFTATFESVSDEDVGSQIYRAFALTGGNNDASMEQLLLGTLLEFVQAKEQSFGATRMNVVEERGYYDFDAIVSGVMHAILAAAQSNQALPKSEQSFQETIKKALHVSTDKQGLRARINHIIVATKSRVGDKSLKESLERISAAVERPRNSTVMHLSQVADSMRMRGLSIATVIVGHHERR